MYCISRGAISPTRNGAVFVIFVLSDRRNDIPPVRRVYVYTYMWPGKINKVRERSQHTTISPPPPQHAPKSALKAARINSVNFACPCKMLRNKEERKYLWWHTKLSSRTSVFGLLSLSISPLQNKVTIFRSNKLFRCSPYYFISQNIPIICNSHSLLNATQCHIKMKYFLGFKFQEIKMCNALTTTKGMSRIVKKGK